MLQRLLGKLVVFFFFSLFAHLKTLPTACNSCQGRVDGLEKACVFAIAHVQELGMANKNTKDFLFCFVETGCFGD